MGKRLDGQTAIVTGAGRGIGRAIARELAATGANIVINYSTSADAAGELADEIREIGQSNYATTKAGIIGFTKSVALEVSRHGITVNAVCPGFTETDMLMEVPEKIRQRILEKIPMGRFGQPEEIASCVRYIVTEGDYMTAQAISINGGVYV